MAHAPSPSSDTRTRLGQNTLARSVGSRGVHTRNNQLIDVHGLDSVFLRNESLTFLIITLARSRGERPRTSARPYNGNSALYVLPQDDGCGSPAQSR